jgi:4,5-DOPA dioxygenase extradiol
MTVDKRMPAVFIGHGSPMNAISDNRFTRAWKSLGESLPRPRAILAVSAHWYRNGTAVTATAKPRTIHDFGGFPAKLYEIEYPAPGDPDLATDIIELLSPMPVSADTAWGLDHATWSVLIHAYPNADIPVVQLALDANKTPRQHLQIGAQLLSLRDRGVLIMGSGNIVHNLEFFDPNAERPYDWAVRFDARIWAALQNHDDRALTEYDRDPDARLAAPDVEHYLPLLYVAGMRQEGDDLKTIVEGFDAGSVSMRAVQVGG